MKLKTNLLPLLAYFVGSIIVFSQGHLISGTVVDVYGGPLPGVTVLEKDTSMVLFLILMGNYVITASHSLSTLVFSYLGFENQTVRIENRRNLDVILLENVESLEEVQVVAFQKQKEEQCYYSSINTIKPELPNSNLTASFAGRLAGVISYQRSGEPGADTAEFFIRGITSFGTSNSPLILIDGLEVNSYDLARVEPDNIASFSIMKDATATSLWSTRCKWCNSCHNKRGCERKSKSFISL